ncbi:MAG: MltA domain-containing protein, partial [Alphaproteobacteria bacterium]
AIGRPMIERGMLDRETVSMQTIRAWLEAHPEQASEIMDLNASYVFFRELDGAGPLGAQGVALTPGRSLAVDRRFVPLSAPVWLDVTAPGGGDARLRRLMIAQDTGGAIKGAVRGDVFWGFGDEAAEIAGAMKARGAAYLLVPRSVTVGIAIP